jgi:hypothetical protein
MMRHARARDGSERGRRQWHGSRPPAARRPRRERLARSVGEPRRAGAGHVTFSPQKRGRAGADYPPDEFRLAFYRLRPDQGGQPRATPGQPIEWGRATQ